LPKSCRGSSARVEPVPNRNGRGGNGKLWAERLEEHDVVEPHVDVVRDCPHKFTGSPVLS
jgi:hypothetical protein